MELIDYLRMLRRQWRWVVGVPVVALVIGYAYLAVTPKVYQASTDMYVGCTVFGNATNAGNAEAVQCRTYVTDGITTYAQLIDSPDVTGKVITDLGLDTTPDALSKRLTASVSSQSLIITVTATAPTGEEAAKIADSAAKNLRSLIATIDVPVPGSPTPLAMTVTHPASVPGVPSSPSKAIILGLSLVLGLAVGLVLATLRDQVTRDRPAGAGAGAGRRFSMPRLPERSRSVPSERMELFEPHEHVDLEERLTPARTTGEPAPVPSGAPAAPASSAPTKPIAPATSSAPAKSPSAAAPASPTTRPAGTPPPPPPGRSASSSVSVPPSAPPKATSGGPERPSRS